IVAGLVLAFGVLLAALRWLLQRDFRMPPWAAAAGLALAVLGPWFTPAQSDTGNTLRGAALALNKPAFLVEDTLRYLRNPANISLMAAAGTDVAYPFLRQDRTPDTLGPHLAPAAQGAPNVVLIVVEGLGRSFSGPGARLGSFTPFLDELAGRSLYFSNFLATQGRTFAVLPSILGSAPFGANGMAALGAAIPPHATLTGILKAGGYDLRFYSGSNLDFDNEAQYLRRAGVETLVGERDFPAGLARSSEWGYADGELFDLVLKREAAPGKAPRATLIQTTSMHTPFAFPDKERYLARAEARLGELGIAVEQRADYRRQQDIYASILYTDDALRRYFDAASKQPGYANTLFVITGDHRLPEIAMATRLERYHVPLIIYSPLLTAPKVVKAVSSHLDIAPSLAALLAQRYGMLLPEKITWLGTGLDLEPGFRNVHAFPLKQTKTAQPEFISGTSYLAENKLYMLRDGMQAELVDNERAAVQARRQLASFIAANNAFARTGTLAPAEAQRLTRHYGAAGATIAAPQLAAQADALYASGVQASLAGGKVRVSARFGNRDAQASSAFVPLLVLVDGQGRQLAEASGPALTLAGGASAHVELSVAAGGNGPLFVAVIPTHPDTGKAIGEGQYHVAVAP
ncbi:MAG TPA: LTA synthase family protein, partial [Burkholderiaceae bacterium]